MRVAAMEDANKKRKASEEAAEDAEEVVEAAEEEATDAEEVVEDAEAAATAGSADDIVVARAKWGVDKDGKREWQFYCRFLDGSEPLYSAAQNVFDDDGLEAVKKFVRKNKKHAKDCLAYSDDPEFPKLVLEHKKDLAIKKGYVMSLQVSTLFESRHSFFLAAVLTPHHLQPAKLEQPDCDEYDMVDYPLLEDIDDSEESMREAEGWARICRENDEHHNNYSLGYFHEGDARYTKDGYYLAGYNCRDCKKKFVDKVTPGNEEKEYRPTPTIPVHACNCIKLELECEHAYCHPCFVPLLAACGNKPASPRRRRVVTMHNIGF